MNILIVGVFTSFVYGLLAKKVGLPSLIGYLAAGFSILFVGEAFLDGNILSESESHALDKISHYGVLLLLFTVGLKLKVKNIAKKEVVGTSVLHFFVSAGLYAALIYYVTDIDLEMSILISCALSFSSTVFAAKTLEDKQELKSYHGQVAIGILVIQDLIAMAFMSFQSGTIPHPMAFLVLAIPLFKPVIHKLFDMVGHDDLMLVFSVLLALVVGGYGFESVGLSGELGALVMGAVLASHEKSSELSEKLWGMKEVLLVCFFLKIGLSGLPTIADFGFAVLVVAFLPVQAVIFFFLLTGFKLKSKSAFLTTVSLVNFSEFGLIVAAAIMPEWVVPIALAVSLSFVFSAPLNRFAHPIYDHLEQFLSRFERDVDHPDEEDHNIGKPNVLVIGLGQVGRASYSVLEEQGMNIVGIDSDQDLVNKLKGKGIRAYFADAEHDYFFKKANLSDLEYCILAVGSDEASRLSASKLRTLGFSGMIYAHTNNADIAINLRQIGVEEASDHFIESGQSMAYKVINHKSGYSKNN